jgi:hypothetical protein
LPAVEDEQAHPRRDQPGGDALRGDHELVVLVSASPSGRRRRPGTACPAPSTSVVTSFDDDVTGIERAVGDVEVEGVVPGRIDEALVVRDHVVAVAGGVVGDAGETADLGALELQSCRQDLLAEEVEPWRGGSCGR